MLSVILPFRFLTAFRKIMVQLGWLIYILVVLQSVTDQWITNQMQNLLANPEGTSPVVYLFGLISIVSSLLFPSVLIVIIVTALNGGWDKLGANLNQILIETLRAWGRSLLWSFALILPGIVKWLRLSLVPLVVMLSPAYERGEIDALDESERLSHGELLPLLILFFLFAGFFPLLLTSFDEFKTIWRTPIPALLLHLADTVLGVIFCLWLLKIYIKKSASTEQSPALGNP